MGAGANPDDCTSQRYTTTQKDKEDSYQDESKQSSSTKGDKQQDSINGAANLGNHRDAPSKRTSMREGLIW